MHKVDIIVPTYNYGRFLDSCLQSAVDQSYGDFQILVIDNASEDNTEDLMHEWLKRDKRIRYVRNETNLGVIKSYRKAFEMTSAEYSLSLCADDLLLPGFLEKVVKNGLEQHPECTFGYSLIHRLTEQGLFPDTNQFLPKLATGAHDLLYHLCFTNWLSPSFVVCRRKVLDELRVYERWEKKFADSARLGSCGDQYQWLMLSTKGPAFVVNEREGIYRIHGQSDSSKASRQRLLEEAFVLYDIVFLEKDVFPVEARYIAQINKIARLMTSVPLVSVALAMAESPHTGPLIKDHLKSILQKMAAAGRTFRYDDSREDSSHMRVEAEESFNLMDLVVAGL
jgi:O-antigen biosynthesis protein